MPVKRHYTLTAERTSAPAVTCAAVLEVRRVRVTPTFERVSLITRNPKGDFVALPFDEFSAPPGLQFRSALSRWMRGSSLFRNVVEPGESARADWILEAEVEWLYASGDDAHLAVRFSISDGRNNENTRLLRYVETAAAQSEAPRDIVDAWNIAIAKIFEQLEGNLHAFLRDRELCADAAGAPELDVDRSGAL